eukprot:875293_1
MGNSRRILICVYCTRTKCSRKSTFQIESSKLESHSIWFACNHCQHYQCIATDDIIPLRKMSADGLSISPRKAIPKLKITRSSLDEKPLCSYIDLKKVVCDQPDDSPVQVDCICVELERHEKRLELMKK